MASRWPLGGLSPPPLKITLAMYVRNRVRCRYVHTTRRTIPKTTSGKIARMLCKKAHNSGALDADTVFLWGDDSASFSSTGAATGKNSAHTAADMDAQAERAEIPSSSSGGGIEESKGNESYSGEDGGRRCPTDMPVDSILEGVQSEVARILKADATAIPTVRRRPCEG